MTDQQRTFLTTITQIATADTQTAEQHPGSGTRRAVAQFSIEQLETTAAELPADEAAPTRETIKELRSRMKALPRPSKKRAA